MKLLIFGDKGQLGWDLTRLAPSFGFEPLGVDLPEVDLTSRQRVAQVVNNAGPLQAVINAAAYTAVDAAENDREKAFAVNRDGAAHVAMVCREADLPLIQVSTDYVFDGLKTIAYLPEDPVDPQSVYGQSKAEGETAVRQQLDRHVIVRTAWLFGLHGHNFVKTMLRLAAEREELRVVDDQIGCPTYAADLAVALLKAAVLAGRKAPVWGTYHFCNEGAVTWYAFTRRIIALAKPYQAQQVKRILPILSSQYPQAAQRPPCAILDCSSFERTFDLQRRPWSSALAEMIQTFFSASSPA